MMSIANRMSQLRQRLCSRANGESLAFFISKDKLEFLLNMRFTSMEISSMPFVSESIIKWWIHEFEFFVRPRYSDISDDDLDHIVERIMREFSNSGYKRMTGLLQNASHGIQQSRIGECMRRVNPDGVLLRALELRAVGRRWYQVSGPLALWHIDGTHKLIRYNIAFKGCMLETWEHTWRQYISESVDGKISTQSHTLIIHASLSLTLFQKRVEFGLQNACIINVWGYAEMFLCGPVLNIGKNYLFVYYEAAVRQTEVTSNSRVHFYYHVCPASKCVLHFF